MTDRIVASPSELWTERQTTEVIEAELEARGNSGYLLGVKANIGVRGLVRSAGCAALDLAPSLGDAPIVAALRETGAVVAGMTNMHELAFGVTSQNPAYGAVAVPGHLGHAAGGSSGGSAAAVAGGAVPVALGTDTGGSISIPASLCGVAGFRPTTGRWPTSEIVGLSWTRDTPGLFAADLERIISLDAAVSGNVAIATSDPARKLRLGLVEGLSGRLAAATQRAWDRTLGSLSQFDSQLELMPIDLTKLLSGAHQIAATIMGWESPRLLAATAAVEFGLNPQEALDRLQQGVQSPDVLTVLQGMRVAPTHADEYARAQAKLVRLRAEYDAILRENQLDGLVFPTTAAPAPRIDVGAVTTHEGRQISVFDLYTRNTEHGTLIGAPMCTFPVPVKERELPVGITVQGARFDDSRLLQIALRCARMTGSPVA